MTKLRLKHWFSTLLIISAAASGQVIADAQLGRISPRLAIADPDRGQKVFLQCRACHVAEEGATQNVGPHLWGIVNRPVASLPDFSYSSSLKALGGKWDYEQLNRYLFHPVGMVPGTRMIFPGIKDAQDRANLIAYLRTLDDYPIALPQPTSSQSDLQPEPTAKPSDPHAVAKKPLQDWRGLPPGPGREEVFYSCNSCHSLMLVTQQGMSRDRWDETLEWMVEEQGMAEFEDIETRDLVLDYLSTHFGSG